MGRTVWPGPEHGRGVGGGSLPATVEWITDRLRGRDWREAFPAMAKTYDPHLDLFDYAAEDAWLGSR